MALLKQPIFVTLGSDIPVSIVHLGSKALQFYNHVVEPYFPWRGGGGAKTGFSPVFAVSSA